MKFYVAPLRFGLLAAIAFVLNCGCGQSEAQKKKQAQEAAAKALVEAFTNLGTANEQVEQEQEDLLEKRTLKIGQTIRLGSLDITPASVELKKIPVKSMFGGKQVLKGPFLVLTVHVKNMSEGQVFRPFMMAQVTDNFDNNLDNGVGDVEVGLIDGNEITKDIAPESTATILLTKTIKIAKATSYQWDVTATVDNKETNETWRCKTDVSEIKVQESQ